jgi:hypothetical protein
MKYCRFIWISEMSMLCVFSKNSPSNAQRPSSYSWNNPTIFVSQGVPLVKQSPYSPSMNSLYRFLFRRLKLELGGGGIYWINWATSCNSAAASVSLRKYLAEGTAQFEKSAWNPHLVWRWLRFSNWLKFLLIYINLCVLFVQCNYFSCALIYASTLDQLA